jgi:hypothetical protein
MRRTQLVISLVALLVALAHLLFPTLAIDGITVMLLAIAVIPWLGPLFKAIELPGGLKVEYQDLLKAERKAEEAGLLAPAAKSPGQPRHVYAFESVAENDPNLALVGLRIEIESRLRDIAESKGIKSENKSAGRLLRELRERGYLSQSESSVIADLLPLLNRAAHGALVDERGSQWALDSGTRILQALEEKKGEESVPQLLARWRSRDGGEAVEAGTELSKALVRSPVSFLRAMKGDSESFNAWLDGLEHHTFTLFESQGELEDDLLSAYYEKLKALMRDAASQCIQGEYGELAKRIVEALDGAKIRRIW